MLASDFAWWSRLSYTVCFLYKAAICTASHYRNEELIVICVLCVCIFSSAHMSIIELLALHSCLFFHIDPYIFFVYSIIFVYLTNGFLLPNCIFFWHSVFFISSFWFFMLSSRVVVIFSTLYFAHLFRVCVCSFLFRWFAYSISQLLSFFIGLHLICLHVTCSKFRPRSVYINTVNIVCCIYNSNRII